jgi:hypothetical protein
MTEPTPEQPPAEPTDPATPEPTRLERVAQLAAEAAVRARPDHGPRLEAVEGQLAEILAALAAAAGPDGNAARLDARLTAVERQLEDLAAAPPRTNEQQQQRLDNLHQRVADAERRLNERTRS